MKIGYNGSICVSNKLYMKQLKTYFLQILALFYILWYNQDINNKYPKSTFGGRHS